MRTCRYCYSSIGEGQCPNCVKKAVDVVNLTVVGSSGRKKGAPKLDIQEGNREEYFGDTHEFD